MALIESMLFDPVLNINNFRIESIDRLVIYKISHHRIIWISSAWNFKVKLSFVESTTETSCE